MSHSLVTLRDRPKLSRTLTEREQELFNQWITRYPDATPKLRASLTAAARSVARHGNPPNRRQRLGYRTAKRRREWAELTGLPPNSYPGRSGQ